MDDGKQIFFIHARPVARSLHRMGWSLSKTPKSAKLSMPWAQAAVDFRHCPTPPSALKSSSIRQQRKERCVQRTSKRIKNLILLTESLEARHLIPLSRACPTADTKCLRIVPHCRLNLTHHPASWPRPFAATDLKNGRCVTCRHPYCERINVNNRR